jgi:predicted nucleic acid-binding protein
VSWRRTYCSGPSSAAAESALRRTEAPVLSVLSEAGFCSLISRERRLLELTERQARGTLDLFETHVAEGFYCRVSLTGEHFLKARHLLGIGSNVLRTLDALHLAAAVTESQAILTADRLLAKAARRQSFSAILVT